MFAPKTNQMKRFSISFTKPNNEWMEKQIISKEYSSKSELINDLVRQARRREEELDWIRMKLDRAEKSGFTTDSRDEILRLF